MADIKDWSEVDASNDQPGNSGWPEGMARSDVNDRGRELMGAIRRWYEDSEWVNLLDHDDWAYTLSRPTASSVRIAQTTSEPDPSDKFEAGSWIEVSDGVTPVICRMASVGSWTGTQMDITVDTIIDPITRASGSLPTTVTSIRCYFARTIRQAGFHPVGSTLAQTPAEIPTIDDLGDVVTYDVGSGNGLDADLLDGQEGSYYAQISRGIPNDLINGCFRIRQRVNGATTATYPPDDNTYSQFDRWLVLTEGASGTIQTFSQNTLADGYFMTMVAQTTNEQFGILQMVEGLDSRKYTGQDASLSFEHKNDAGGLGQCRAMILYRTGGADSRAGTDPITTWGAENATISAFAAQWGVAGETTFTPTTGWNRVTLTAAIPSTAYNVAVFIYCNDKTHSTLEDLDLRQVMLEQSSTPSESFKWRSAREELALCQRFYQKTFDLATEPKDNQGNLGELLADGSAGGRAHFLWHFKCNMRDTPTINTFNPSAGTAGEAERQDASGTDHGITATQIGEASAVLRSNDAITNGAYYGIHADAVAEL